VVSSVFLLAFRVRALTHLFLFSLLHAVNVFSGILDNHLFVGILITTAVLQALIVQYGSLAFHVADDGLEAKYWGLCMALGFGSLPVQQVINVMYRVGQHYKGIRLQKRVARDRSMTTMRANGGAHSHRD